MSCDFCDHKNNELWNSKWFMHGMYEDEDDEYQTVMEIKGGNLEVRVHPNVSIVEMMYGIFAIRFCPMCGEELEN